ASKAPETMTLRIIGSRDGRSPELATKVTGRPCRSATLRTSGFTGQASASTKMVGWSSFMRSVFSVRLYLAFGRPRHIDMGNAVFDIFSGSWDRAKGPIEGFEMARRRKRDWLTGEMRLAGLYRGAHQRPPEAAAAM